MQKLELVDPLDSSSLELSNGIGIGFIGESRVKLLEIGFHDGFSVT